MKTAIILIAAVISFVGWLIAFVYVLHKQNTQKKLVQNDPEYRANIENWYLNRKQKELNYNNNECDEDEA